MAPESLPNVLEHWQRIVEDPEQPQQYRLNVLHRDGSHIPMEINGLGTVVDGEFAGGHGSVRDIRERVALEEGLRRQTVELSRAVEVQRTLGEIAGASSRSTTPARRCSRSSTRRSGCSALTART